MISSPTLQVNLSAIVANWQTLRAQFSGKETAAVVKANAYGLGAIPVTRALSTAGCHTFFVATIEEAVELREHFPDIRILVFHGVNEGEEFAFRQHRIIPVLSTQAQIARWKPVATEHRDAVSALHIDTGMNRLGLTPREWEALDADTFEATRVSLILSHLACASEPTHPKNAEQLALFTKLASRTQGIPLSLCNSGGIYLDRSFHFDLARPGCSLYGISPNPQISMRSVAEWTAPILQIRVIDQAQSVGYGATRDVPKGTRIATVACGYADGYHRILSNTSYGILAGHRVELLGRVTMDMLSFDVTNVPEDLVYESARITLLGADPSVDALAERAGTIGYEILTSIGLRVKREYIGEAA